MPITWQTKKLEDSLEKVVYTKKIQRKDFLDSGTFPVISQEEDFINGFWNNKNDLFKATKPLIIFGDHTQVLKYVDFDFVLGADGVKILKPKSFLDSKFFYYFLRNINLKSLGYARHYRLLKELEVVYPEALAEQQRIVKILDEVFEKMGTAKDIAEKNLKNSQEFFESYLQKVFVSKKKDWDEEKLGEVCEMINRGVSPRYIESGGVCVLNQKCIRDHKINYEPSRKHDIKSKKVSKEKFIQIGDVLVNSTGTGTLGRVAQVKYLNFDTIVDSHITIVRPTKSKFYNEFFGYALIYIEKEIAKQGAGTSGQTELARNVLKENFTISYPKSLIEQKAIVKKLDELSGQTKKLEEIYRRKLELLEELKKSVLAKAFRGEL